MGIRVPNLAVLFAALVVGGLAVYVGNTWIAAVCFAIAAAYSAAMVWQWRRERNKR